MPGLHDSCDNPNVIPLVCRAGDVCRHTTRSSRHVGRYSAYGSLLVSRGKPMAQREDKNFLHTFQALPSWEGMQAMATQDSSRTADAAVGRPSRQALLWTTVGYGLMILGAIGV